jgi:peroxiredoxin
MKNKIRFVRFSSLISIFLLGASLLTAGPEVGKPAPAFEVKGAKGEVRKLEDFKGKYVVLEWLNHGCPWVKKHYNSKNMQNLQKKYTDDGVIWLSVVSSKPGTQGHMTVEEALATYNDKGVVATDILLDETGAMGKSYDARTTPEIFIINPEGILIYKGAIDSDNSQKAENLKDATNYVETTFEAVKAGKEVEISETKSYGCSVKY